MTDCPNCGEVLQSDGYCVICHRAYPSDYEDGGVLRDRTYLNYGLIRSIRELRDKHRTEASKELRGYEENLTKERLTLYKQALNILIEDHLLGEVSWKLNYHFNDLVVIEGNYTDERIQILYNELVEELGRVPDRYERVLIDFGSSEHISRKVLMYQWSEDFMMISFDLTIGLYKIAELFYEWGIKEVSTKGVLQEICRVKKRMDRLDDLLFLWNTSRFEPLKTPCPNCRIMDDHSSHAKPIGTLARVMIDGEMYIVCRVCGLQSKEDPTSEVEDGELE